MTRNTFLICRFIWRGFLVGGLLAAVETRGDVRDTVKRLLSATVAIEWKATSPEKNPGGEPARTDTNVRATVVPYSAAGQTQVYVVRPDSVAFVSGTVVSRDGLIVTANLDADNKAELTVSFSDGRKLPARRMVMDGRSGLQLLKVEATDLASVELTDLDAEIGDDVVTVMCSDVNARQAGRGIVTATNRTAGTWFYDLIQTDIAAGVMSAGSPLAEPQGRVIGILAARTESPWPSSLAVPARYVRDLLSAVKADQQVTLKRGYLGAHLGTQDEGGVVLAKITDDSPAKEAGLQQGDVVISIGKTAVRSIAAMMREIGRYQGGQVVPIEVRRDEKTLRLEIQLKEVPEQHAPRVTSLQRVQVVQPPYVYVAPQVPAGTPVPPTAPALPLPLKVDPNATPPLIYVVPETAPRQPTVYVQRSDLEKKLDALTHSVQGLHEQMSKMNEELKKLRERN